MSSVKTNACRFASAIESLRKQACEQVFCSKSFDRQSGSLLSEYLEYYGFDSSGLSDLARYEIGALEYNNMQLIAHSWSLEKTPPGKSKGTVILSHGLFDHVGLYLKVIKVLLELEYSVFAPDFPGHGLSEGPSAEIDNFSDYAEVLHLALTKVLQKNPEEKIFLLGQSTGGAAIVHYLLSGEYSNKIEKAVLLAPLLRPKSWWYVNISWLVFNKFISHIPRRFAVNSSDQEFLDFLANCDPLQPREISLKWIAAMRLWVKNFSNFSSCDTEVLFLQGDDDGTVDWEYNLPAFQLKLPNSRLELIKGAKHHLVNESEEFFRQIKSSIENFLR